MKKILAVGVALVLFSMVMLPISSAAENDSESNDTDSGLINQPSLTLTYSNEYFIVTNEGDETAQNVRFTLDVKASFFFFSQSIVIDSVEDLAPGDSWEVPLRGLVYGLGPVVITAQASADNAEDSNKIEFSCFLLGPFIFGLP